MIFAALRAQQFGDFRHDWYAAPVAVLGVVKHGYAPFQVNVLPVKAHQFPAPHAGGEGKQHDQVKRPELGLAASLYGAG